MNEKPLETPLSVALAAQKPIPLEPRQPLEIERLLTESQRRIVTIADHERFVDWLTTGQPIEPDADLASEKLETPTTSKP